MQPETISRNKHYIYPELQQPNSGETNQDDDQEIDCSGVTENIETDEMVVQYPNNSKEDENKECDFRKMPKVNEAKGGKVKRLQAGAKDMKKKYELRRKTGTVLTKIALTYCQKSKWRRQEKGSPCMPTG